LSLSWLAANLARFEEAVISTISPNPEGSYSMGPPLPAEILKPPFTPKAAGWIAFFFGPLGGALVSAISLRRMRHPEKARKVTTIAVLAATLVALVLMLIPESLTRVVGLGAEAAFYVIFPKIQESEFAAWQMANATILPSSGWKAIGWGVMGLILFVLIAIAVVFGLSMLGVQPR
jgi:hypothetical protein